MQTHQDYYQDIGGNDSNGSWGTGSEIVCGLPSRRDNKQIPYESGMTKNDIETNASLDQWHVDLVASTPDRSQSIRDANQTKKKRQAILENSLGVHQRFFEGKKRKEMMTHKKAHARFVKKMSYLKGSWKISVCEFFKIISSIVAGSCSRWLALQSQLIV